MLLEGKNLDLAAGNTMTDDSVPPDPWSEPPPTWTAPPLRYPKGLERIRGPEDEEVVRPRRKPRPPKKDRKEAKLKEEDEKGFEEADVLARLRLFARDPSMQAYYKGVGLPGEGESEFLDLMRRCIRAAEGDYRFPSFAPSALGCSSLGENESGL